jgi:hypothetical protein
MRAFDSSQLITEIRRRFVASNAAAFGLPGPLDRDTRGWWQLKGVRDIVT